MPLTDLSTLLTPATGATPSAAWAQAVRDDIEWIVNPPQFSIYTTTGSGSSAANNVLTEVPCQNENYDTDGMHTGSNAYVTINTAGKWQFWTVTQWADSGVPSGGDRLLEFFEFTTAARLIIHQAAAAPNPYQTCFSGTRTDVSSVGYVYMVRTRHTAYAGTVSSECIEFSGRWIGR